MNRRKETWYEGCQKVFYYRQQDDFYITVAKLKMDLFSIRNKCKTSPFLISWLLGRDDQGTFINDLGVFEHREYENLV